MDVAEGAIVERIARVLAARRLSSNAAGTQPSAAADVDDAWPEYQDDAIAILHTLREPDREMAAVGDVAVWERMIAAALGRPIDAATASDPGMDAPEPGTDPLHEGP